MTAAALAAMLTDPAAAHPSRGIVVAADGTVFFSDLVTIRAIYPGGRVQVLRANDEGHTHVLALAADGTVWGDLSIYNSARSTYREAIWRMLPNGSLTYRYGPRTGPERGEGLLRDRRGCTWHADRTAPDGPALVHRKCPGRAVERLFGSRNDDRAFTPVLVNDVSGSALAADGGFVFRDRGTIRRIAPDGSASVIARGRASENFGIALGSEGRVLVAEHAARRVVVVAPGRKARTLTVSAAPWAPTGVAWRNSTLYVLEAEDYAAGRPERMRVRRITTDGGDRVLATVTLPTA